ncbi:hypothetical protein QAD02_024383 [Eretmocerus hayati]|uniref:Uncharacterized protein n=1 Tax=Eretmocerus hayati TaxID=131215 RepID=A0ACC2Q068_9HYME|nr:hypothetical protein QAD02_024383 [Eretmocerus hayati]
MFFHHLIAGIFVLMTVGLMGLVMGCLIMVTQPYEFIFQWKATFGPGGEIYEIWRAPPVDLYLKVYLFNVTNHKEYMARNDTKIKFQQIGPYVYKEMLEHGNVTFNGNGTVTAVPMHPLKFVPELSNGTEEDFVIMPNIALLSIANVMKDSFFVTRMGLNSLIVSSNTQPLVNMTAKEFMFGYRSTLVSVGNSFLPGWIKFEKLGLIDRMYDFEGDYETVYTGETDVRPNETLRFFRKSLCRSASMVQTGEKIVKGLHTYRYKFKDHELDNGRVNPENKCFCRNDHCLPYGLIDVTDCYYGFPIALSYPHFYQTDPKMLEAVEGLNPVKDIHESYFYINPRSGLPVDIAFRFQINMALQDISAISNVDGFSNLVLPLLWFEIGMHDLPPSLYYRFFFYLNVLPTVQELGIYCLFLGGGICLIWSVWKILTYKPTSDPSATSQLIEAERRKRLNEYFNSAASDRRPSLRSKEMDVYFNSLLSTKEEEAATIDPALLEAIPDLKEVTV